MPDDTRSPSSAGREALSGDASAPWLTTEVPGPQSRAWVDRLAGTECPAITARRSRRAGESGVSHDPIVWARGAGAVIEDVDGNRYVDFTAAFAVSGYGHAHPELVAALQQQAVRLMHGMGDVFPTDVKIAFTERLAQVTPGALAQSILAQSGAEAVEAALKTAVLAAGRPRVLAFHGSYHGLSLGALSVTAYRDSFRAPFAHHISQQVTHAPYPTCYRCPFGLTRPSCGLACLTYLRELVRHPACGAEAIGTVILEPIQARGGIIEPPPGWLEGVADLCKEARLVLVVDEIYTGFGRTGRWFAVNHTGVEPDVMCLGKAMTGGFPMSAAIGTPAVMAAWGASQGESIHTSTFLGNPMGCAVGLKALELLEREGYDRVAEARGAELRAGLERLRARWPDHLGDLRGRGLMLGLEVVRSAASREPWGALVLAIMRRMLERGFLILPSGVWGQVLAFTPPFVVDSDQLAAMLEALEASIADCLSAA